MTKELPLLLWRCGTLLLLTILSTGATVDSPLQRAEPTRRIAFQLENRAVGRDGLPHENWVKQLTPGRDNNVDPTSIQALHLPAKVLDNPLFHNIFSIEPSASSDPGNQIQTLLKSDGVLWAEYLPERHTDALGGTKYEDIDSPPSDPFYSLQWSLDKIHAPAAWDVTEGDPSIIIAVVDAGTDIGHGDLIQQLWVNRSEAEGQSGVDDDGNGYIDDVNGWDFYDDDPDPRPRAGDNHGTHVSGIACAGTDNRFGIAGVSYNCRLMAIRAGAGRGITNGFEGLIYAAVNGADVVNLSWGGEDISQLERIAIQYATEQGCLVVAAAGNLGGSQSFDHYPAAYDEVLAVASTDDHDLRSDFSNTGVWVDLSAPGSSIYSLFANQGYGLESGTSMASPIVAGAAGLLKSLHPDWTPTRLKKQLEISCDKIDAFNGIYAGKLGAGRLNLYRALADARSSIVVSHTEIIEPTGDGVIDPGEHIQIVFDLFNPLVGDAKFSIRVTSQSPLLFLEDIVYDSLALAPNSHLITEDLPFRARVSANTADNILIKCNLQITFENGEINRIPFSIGVRRAYETVRNDQIALTVADMGSLGYYDYTKDIGYGEGFRYPANGLSALFHGSLMVGASGNRVSDNAYGNDNQNSYDFLPIEAGVRAAHTDSVSTLQTHFSDEEADTVLGLEIWQTTSVRQGGGNNSYALIENRLVLMPGQPSLDSVAVGLYLDWDINNSDANVLNWEGDIGLGWMESVSDHESPVNNSVFGVGVVGEDAEFYGGVNRADINRSWADSDKSDIFRSGFTRSSGETPDDWAQIIGAGPFSLAEGETLRVAFAVLGGNSVESLRETLRTARDRFGSGSPSREPLLPISFGISSAYPNPFNSQTKVLCRLSIGSEFDWGVWDANGRRAIGGLGVVTQSTVVPVTINAGGLSAGYYVFKLNSAGDTYSTPLILVK